MEQIVDFWMLILPVSRQINYVPTVIDSKVGAGNVEKRRWIRNLCNKHKINFLTVQETKTESVDIFTVRSIWGNPVFSHEWSPARGQSGGIWVI
ncbi:hypothetical protein LXL04_017498 [Taraxacum kok-saghyz]